MQKQSVFVRILLMIGSGLLIGITAGLAVWGTLKLTGVIGETNLFSGAVQDRTSVQDRSSVQEETPPETTASGEIRIGAKPADSAGDGAVTEAPAASAAPIAVAVDVTAVVEKCMPSVVAITAMTEIEYNSWFMWGQSEKVEVPSSGSGILIGESDDEYMIVTNNHVVNNTNTLTVAFIDEESAPAQIKGRDSNADVAVIAVKKADVSEETKKKIRIAEIGDSNQLKVGQGVVAIGNALGVGQSVTTGVISALDRDFESKKGSDRKLIQTDAAINPGNSGGALLNMAGQIIGINEAKYASTEVEGMGYAIPISTIVELIEEFSKQETREKLGEDEQGYLGIQGLNVEEDMSEMYGVPTGAYVHKILEGTGAGQSDLREKDIIIKVEKQPVNSMEDLKDIISRYRIGETVTITVERLDGGSYKQKDVKVTLGKRPETTE